MGYAIKCNLLPGDWVSMAVNSRVENCKNCVQMALYDGPEATLRLISSSGQAM